MDKYVPVLQRMIRKTQNQQQIQALIDHYNNHPNYMTFDPDLCFRLNGHRNLQDAIDNGEIYSNRQITNMGCIEKMNFSAEQWFSDIEQFSTAMPPPVTISFLILVYIGNHATADQLLDQLEKSVLSKGSFIAIAVNKTLYEYYKVKVTQLASAVFLSNQHGTDIIPSLQMYYTLRNQYGIGPNTPVIKLHTKSDIEWFTAVTNYLLTKSWDQLEVIYKESGQNTITAPEYMKTLAYDVKFCDQYKLQHKNIIKTQDISGRVPRFAAGTIFYTHALVLNCVINFMFENNFRSYFINNMYVCNNIIRNSPIHFLERLFGVIKLI